MFGTSSNGGCYYTPLTSRSTATRGDNLNQLSSATSDDRTSAGPVSVLGLGNMGSALAAAFVSSGQRVTVWNRTPARMEPLREKGAACASGVRGAFDASPVVVLCAGDHSTGQELLEQADESVRGRTVISLTAGAPEQAKTMARWLDDHGARFVEGMIMVFPQAIGTKDARVLYAAPDDVFEAITPVISALGGSQVHVSEIPGSVSALGTAATGFFHMGFQAFALMAETARRSGVDLTTSTAELVGLLDVLGEAMTASPPALGGEVRSSDTSTLALGADEMGFVLQVMGSLGMDLSLVTAAKDSIDRAVSQGYGDGPLGSVIHGLTIH
jgi:3-hydroxyisobutyrate dehydrogenase-like beta-hydroxyacid dehydrogenase